MSEREWRIDDDWQLAVRTAVAATVFMALSLGGEIFVGQWASRLIGAVVVCYGFGAVFGLWTLFGYEVSAE